METLSPIQPERPCGLQLHVDPQFPVTMPTLQQKPQPMLPGFYQILSLPAYLPQRQLMGTTLALVMMGPLGEL